MSAADRIGYCLSACGRNINRLTNKDGRCGLCIAKREPTTAICQSCGHVQTAHERGKACERCSCKAYVAFDGPMPPSVLQAASPVASNETPAPAAPVLAGDTETVPPGRPGGHCPICGSYIRTNNTRGCCRDCFICGPIRAAEQRGDWMPGQPFKASWVAAIRAKRGIALPIVIQEHEAPRKSKVNVPAPLAEEAQATVRWTCPHGCQYDKAEAEGGADHCDNCAPCRTATIAAHQAKLAEEESKFAKEVQALTRIQLQPEVAMTPPSTKAPPSQAAVAPPDDIGLLKSMSMALKQLGDRLKDPKAAALARDARAHLFRLRLELDALETR